MELKRSRFTIALALVALVAPTTFSAPATRSTCSPVCRKSEDSKVNYQEGKSYQYNFETEVITQVIGSSDETSRIKVKGQAVIAAQSSCDFTLTLQQVAIQNPSGQAISRVDDIEGSSLRFAYQNGEIESVCVSEDDPTWSANVKRAVISLLVNKATNVIGDVSTIETDISGRCPTTYQISGQTYTKSRDLNACTDRDGGASVFLGVPYKNVPSKQNSITVIDSALTCTQEIQEGVFQSVSCVETHKIPFLSTSSTGVQTEIKTSLNLVSSQDGIQGASRAATKSSNVFYDHSEVQNSQRQKASASRATDYLNKICQEIEDGTVSSKVPSLFLQLIKSLKSARKDDIKQMYERITTGGICSKATDKLEKIFVDAAATSSSNGAIAFISELIVNDQAQCHTKALFHARAAFAPHPDAAALEAVETLISKSDVESEYLLTASAIAHQYCRMTNPQCASNNEYHSLVDKIAQHVRSAEDEESTKKVVAALQSLGNLDQLTPSAVSKIVNLLNDKSTSERLRVRALDAFRRDPCQPQLKQKAFEIFGNIKESSHIRIQAYLTLSKCVEQVDIETIQNILNNEESNQVGSFVASHIENVLESASPSKQNEKKAFSQLSIPEHLNRSARKVSRNSEYSSFISNYNVGGSLEGNVIFSQDSYLPRMTTANLTLDAFGRSYNFLEVGLYAEEFEHVVEKYFGPVGKFRKSNLERLISAGSEKLTNFVEGVKSRFRRDVSTDVNQNEIDTIKNQVHIEERTGDEGVGDVYIRILGTSVLAESFSETKLREGSFTNKLKRGIEKILDGAKEHKFDVTYPVVFVDEELVLPTFSGFPLNLEIEGSSVLSMQLNGNVDITALFRGESISDMRTKIIPSAATVLKSRMTVGTGPVESGLQLEGKIHSSAGVDIKVLKEDGKFEFRFNLPQERTQVIDMRSDLYWVEQPQDSLEKKTLVQSKLVARSLIDNNCFNSFSKALGLKVCADVKVPTASSSAPFPVLNGPSVVSLTIEKSEASMEGYYLKIEKKNQDGENFGLDFHLDTPGSRTNRKIEASVKALRFRSTTPEYLFKLESPWTKLEVDCKRSLTDTLKGIELKVVSDGEAYNGKLQMKRVKSGSVSKYEPVAQYSLPGGKPVKLIEGQIVRVEGEGKVEIDLRTAGPFKSLRGSVKGIIEIPEKENGFEVKAKDLQFSSDMVGKLILDGHVKKIEKILETKIHLKYGSQQAEHTIEHDFKVGKTSDNQYELKTKTRSSRNPFFNFDLHAEASRIGNTYKSEVTYTRGLEEPKVLLIHKLSTTIESKRNFEIFHEAIVKHAYLNLDMHLKLDAQSIPGSARHADFLLNVNSFKSKAKYESAGQNLLDYIVKADADYDNTKYEFTEVSTKAGDNKQNWKGKLSVTPGFWVAADTDVTYKFEPSDFENIVSSTITSDQLAAPVILKSGLRGKSDVYSSFVKFDMKNKNYVDFATQFKYSKGSKPGTLNFKNFILGYIDSKLVQTWTSSQSDVQVDIKWLPTGRKIEGKSKLVKSGDKFDMDSEVKWDAERDPSKSATLKSANIISFSKWQFDSKNDITVEGKASKLNVKGQRMKEFFNGDDKLEIDYVSPTGKAYNAATVLSLENKLKVKGVKLDVQFSLPEQKPYKLTWENRVSNINTHEKTFEVVSNFKFDYKGEKDVIFKTEVSSLLPGNYRSYVGKVQIGGSVVREVVSADVKVDLKRGKLVVKGAANRGTRSGDVDMTVEYDCWSPKKTLDVKYTVNTPYEHVRAFEGLHKVGFLFNSLRSFEYTEEGSVSFNHGGPAQWKYLLSLLNTEAKYLSEYTSEGQSVYKVTADAKITAKKLFSNMEAIYKGEKAFFNIDLDHHRLPKGADFDLKGGIPKSSFELKANYQRPSPGIYESDILAKLENELAFRITNKLELTPTKKAIDMMVATAEEPTRRVNFALNKATDDTYNVEALLRWGEGDKFLASKGDLTKSGESFDGTLSFDSPELKANQMTIKISKKSQGGRHAVTFKVQEQGNTDKFSAIFDYGTGMERSGAQKTYDGSVTVKGDKNSVDIDFNGKFHLEDDTLARQRGDSEDGREIRGSFEVGKSGTPIKGIKGTAVFKASDKEKRAQFSICNEDKGRCRSGDAHFRHQHESNGDLEYSLRIVGEIDASGHKTITGVSILTSKTQNGRQMDHTVKLILNKQDSEQVGYRIYRKDGYEFGAEILLPERAIATVLDIQNTQPTDLKVDLSFFIDKTRQPNRKISLIFSTEDAKPSSGIARDIELLFRHPDIEKDLKLHTKYTFGGDSTKLFEVKTVIDIFKANSEIVMSYKAHREAISEGHLYKTLWSVTSKGQSINFGGKSEISRLNGQLSFKNELHYENREKQTKTAKIETLLSVNRMSFEVKGHSGKLVSLISSFEEHPTGYEYRQDVLFPGMEDTRIFQTMLTTTSPRKVQVKTYTTTSPSGVYYEAMLGFKTHDHFIAGVYDHETSGKKVLADVNVALNNSRILFVKSNWERQNLANVATKAQARFSRNAKNLRQMVSSSVEEVVKELQFASTNMRKAMPNLKTVLSSTKSQFADLVVELDAHEDTKLLLDQLQIVQGYFNKFTIYVLRMTTVFRKMAVNVIQVVRVNIQKIPEYLRDYSSKIPYTMEDFEECMDTFMFTVIDVFRKTVKLWTQTLDNIQESMPEIIRRINLFLDYTSGLSDCIREFMEKALNKFASVWKCVRNYTKNIMNNELVQLFVQDSMQLLQIVLSEFIEETKDHAESFKNYLLEAIPEEEFQQLVQLSAEYVEKKAKNEPVDDVVAIKEIYEKLVQLVKKIGARFFTLDMEDGIFIATIPLPIPIKNLSDLGKVFDKFSFPSPPSIKYNLPSYKLGIQEVINKIRHGASLDEFVPPYSGYALIVGSQHYKTFDGKFFKFDGSCQYLLASDFEDGNFTVVVDFDRKGSNVEKSVIIKDSQDTIAIKKDSVFINGGQVTVSEEPQTIHNFKIQTYHEWTVIKGSKGVALGCSSAYDVCVLKVDGYYHGKVMGLFGKFNHETYDDMTTPNGEITDNLSTFVQSWKTESGCREQPNAEIAQMPTPEAIARCSDAFESSSSSLRPCYSVVDATNYKGICEKLSSKSGYNVRKAVCTSATAYSKACKMQYAEVDNLQECRSI